MQVCSDVDVDVDVDNSRLTMVLGRPVTRQVDKNIVEVFDVVSNTFPVGH